MRKVSLGDGDSIGFRDPDAATCWTMCIRKHAFVHILSMQDAVRVCVCMYLHSNSDLRTVNTYMLTYSMVGFVSKSTMYLGVS